MQFDATEKKNQSIECKLHAIHTDHYSTFRTNEKKQLLTVGNFMESRTENYLNRMLIPHQFISAFSSKKKKKKHEKNTMIIPMNPHPFNQQYNMKLDINANSICFQCSSAINVHLMAMHKPQ